MPGIPMPAAVHAGRLAAVSVMATTAATLAPVATAEARRSASLDRQEAKIVRLVNQTRRDHGLSKLRAARALNRAANGHSWRMIRADFFSHTSPDGSTPAQRIRRRHDADSVGEVLGWVPRSQRRGAARRIVSMWMRSASHRDAVLSGAFARIGVARQIGRLGDTAAVVYTADLSSRR